MGLARDTEFDCGASHGKQFNIEAPLLGDIMGLNIRLASHIQSALAILSPSFPP